MGGSGYSPQAPGFSRQYCLKRSLADWPESPEPPEPPDPPLPPDGADVPPESPVPVVPVVVDWVVVCVGGAVVVCVGGAVVCVVCVVCVVGVETGAVGTETFLLSLPHAPRARAR